MRTCAYTCIYEDLLRYKETTLPSMEMIEEMVLCLVGESGSPLIVGGGMRDWVKKGKNSGYSPKSCLILEKEICWL